LKPSLALLFNFLSLSFVVNAAGLYADKVAHDFVAPCVLDLTSEGFGLNYAIMPFKGIYLYCNDNVKLSEHERSRLISCSRTNIYPVPNMKFPFLGVHFTVTVDGHVRPSRLPSHAPRLRSGQQRSQRYQGNSMASCDNSLRAL
jgi:(S)-2-hydroxyglutarate dehydrogenase